MTVLGVVWSGKLNDGAGGWKVTLKDGKDGFVVFDSWDKAAHAPEQLEQQGLLYIYIYIHMCAHIYMYICRLSNM